MISDAESEPGAAERDVFACGHRRGAVQTRLQKSGQRLHIAGIRHLHSHDT
jgi:hypothetical protein